MNELQLQMTMFAPVELIRGMDPIGKMMCLLVIVAGLLLLCWRLTGFFYLLQSKDLPSNYAKLDEHFKQLTPDCGMAGTLWGTLAIFVKYTQTGGLSGADFATAFVTTMIGVLFLVVSCPVAVLNDSILSGRKGGA